LKNPIVTRKKDKKDYVEALEGVTENSRK